jgi:hypothetical protein
MSYTRFVIGEDTLSSTSAFGFSHPAIFSHNQIVHLRACCWALIGRGAAVPSISVGSPSDLRYALESRAKRATRAQRRAPVAPAKAKSGKKASPAKKAPKGRKKGEAAKPEGARGRSKTARILELLKQPGGK